MSDHNRSFRDMNVKEKVIVVTAITSLILFSLSFAIGIFYFGFVGIFSLLGIQFDSYYSLLVFVLLYFVVGIFTDIVSMALVTISYHYISGKLHLFFTRMFIDCTITWLLLFTLDEFMHSITIPFSIEILMAVLLFIIGIAFDDKKIKGS